MKHIKLFEKLKIKPKQFLLEESIGQDTIWYWYYIWEITAHDKKEYYIAKRYTLTPWLVLINEYNDEETQPCDEKNLLNNIVMQSDDIQDLLDELQIKIDAKKYNL